MTEAERKILLKELSEIEAEIKLGESVPPKLFRRADEIRSLLMTGGQSQDVRISFKLRKKSQRVTSFTRDGR